MANYPPWMPQPPPPVDSALAGAPGPWWAQNAVDVQPQVPAPWVDLSQAQATAPPITDELSGAPVAGAPPAPMTPPPDAGVVDTAPIWADGPQGVRAPKPDPLPASKTAGKPKNGQAPAPEADPAARASRNGRPMSYADVIAAQAGEEQGSIARAGELQAAQEAKKAEGMAAQAAFEQAQIRDQHMQEMERRRDLAQREQQLEAERQALASTKIDPNRWSSSRKAQLMVGGAVGGILAVTSGSGKNGFMEIAGQRIAEDIESQKAELANRQEALGRGQTMYAQLLNRYQDERVADGMYMAAEYTAIGHEFAAQAAQYESPKAKEAARMGMIQAGQRATAAVQAAAAAQQEMQLRKSADARAWRAEKRAGVNDAWGRDQDVAKLALEYEKLGLAQAEARAKARKDLADAAAAEKSKDGLALYGPDGLPIKDPNTGRTLLAGDKSEIAEKQRTRMAARFNFRRQVSEYERYMKDIGREFKLGKISRSEALSRGQTMWASGLFSTKESEGTGALDKGMVEIYEQYVPKPATYFDDQNPGVGANQALADIDGKIDNSMRAEFGYTAGSWTANYDRDHGQSPEDVQRAEDAAKLSNAKNYSPSEMRAYQEKHPQERPLDLPAPEETTPPPPKAVGMEKPTVVVHRAGTESTGTERVEPRSLPEGNYVRLLDGSFVALENQPEGVTVTLPNGKKWTTGGTYEEGVQGPDLSPFVVRIKDGAIVRPDMVAR